METCLGFNIECGTLAKGAGVTIMAFILFVGSVYRSSRRSSAAGSATWC